MRLSLIVPPGLRAVGADAAAVLSREVAADVVLPHLVVVGTVEQPDAAGEVGAGIGDDPVAGNDDVVVLVVGVGRRQVRSADADGAVGAAVVLHHVVGDLQVACIGVGKDRAALGGESAGLAGGQAGDRVDVGRETLLIAAAQIEAVDRGRRIGAEGRREGVGSAVSAGTTRSPRRRRRSGCRPRSAHRSAVYQSSNTGPSPANAPPSMIEPRSTVAAHRVRAARADALQLDPLGDDEVLVVRAARVLARIDCWGCSGRPPRARRQAPRPGRAESHDRR